MNSGGGSSLKFLLSQLEGGTQKRLPLREKEEPPINNQGLPDTLI